MKTKNKSKFTPYQLENLIKGENPKKQVHPMFPVLIVFLLVLFSSIIGFSIGTLIKYSIRNSIKNQPQQKVESWKMK